MENNMPASGGKKLKITVGILAALIILIAAYFTASKITYNNKLSSSAYPEAEVGLGAMPLPKSLPAQDSMGMALENSAGAPAESSIAPETDKKVIKNGKLALKVDRVDEAVSQISDIAKANGGQIFSSNITQNKNNIKSGYVTVKVPVDKFEDAMAKIKKAAVLVVRESTSGQDVTEQYQDIEAQLKNKQADEQSYVKISAQAQKMDDVLAVTRQLSMVRGEIERLQGRIKFMDSQTDMATINVNLSEDEDITVVDSWRPFQIIKEAINSLIKSALGFVNFVIVLIITVIPVAILYFIIVYILYRIGKRIYTKIKARKENVQ